MACLVKPSCAPAPLPPSTVINQDLFLRTFGFPIQLLRAGAAVVSAWAIIRFLRSFEFETQRKIAALQEEQLHEAQRREALHGKLLKQIVSAQEAERQRIARELHDATGQSLTAIGLGLRGISNTLRQDTDKAAENLRQLEGLVARSLDELQRLIADLRPSHLDDLGLPAALRWYAGEVQSRMPLNITVEINGEPRPIDPVANTALFRVAQEALTNVVKHAQATKATVRLSYLPSVVMLQVEDDGCGFDVRAQAQRPAWGLLGMEERATLLGGNVVIQSQPWPRHARRNDDTLSHLNRRSAMTTRLLLVDDHKVVRSGLRMLLENESDLTIVGEAGTGQEALQLVEQLQPDLVLMDIGLPDLSGIDVTHQIKQRWPNVAIVALTIHEDEEYFFKMLQAGVNGYVPKRAAPEELLTAVRTAIEGGVYLYPSLAKLLVKDYLAGERPDQLDGLTEREQEILAHLAEGASNEAIAETLNISQKTVSRHRENIMRKLNLHSRADLVKYAIRKGIIRA